ncbi:MAG: RsmD family RNA methyltransferase [bacterium]|nr:RsmD family RNA methyltransferase [bacterium]
MNKYLFFLGIHPELSTAEIKAVFSGLNINYKIEQSSKKNLIVLTQNELDTDNLINRLGGTIKIALSIGEDNNINTVVNFLMNSQPDGKIQFSLSGIGEKEPLNVKKLLKDKGRSVRYVKIKNTASILHNNLVKKQGDLSIVGKNVYVTKAIQPIEELSKRDFGRPGSDSFSGMLPPKLARIMINLTETNFDANLLDAFCGSGTVLSEALAMGYKNIFASDISPKAISDTEKNIKWTLQMQNEKFRMNNVDYKLFNCDVAELTKKIKTNSIDAIISEPYMGKPLRGNENKKILQNQSEELSQLYVSAFNAFKKILVSGGIVVFIIPSFKYMNNWIQIDCVDKINNIGFEVKKFDPNTDSLEYYREGQHLKRNIWMFIKK